MDELVLNTNDVLRKKNDLIGLAVLGGIMSVVLFVLTRSSGWGIFAASEVIMLLALAFTYFKSAKNGGITLHFKGDSLELTYTDGRKYSVKDVDRSYFSLTQTQKQKEQNVGTLTVQSTNFKVQYINDFDKLQSYLATHFEKKEAKSIYYFDEEDEE